MAPVCPFVDVSTVPQTFSTSLSLAGGRQQTVLPKLLPIKSCDSPFPDSVGARRKACNSIFEGRQLPLISASILRPIHKKRSALCAAVEGLEISKEEEVEGIKKALYSALEGTNRGIFGLPSNVKWRILGLLEQLEDLNPLPNPISEQHLPRAAGQWRLLFSTINILGPKRTKLGLREFVELGDFVQTVNASESQALNRISFRLKGLRVVEGFLTIQASFSVASPTRVDIKFIKSEIVPEQLRKLFEKNYELLLSIFNPEGWLEITYLDERHRIGRDDKGHIYFLERVHAAEGQPLHPWP
eukprot:TRINITY_DN5282_c0_g1_i2.p1 TRINITY_DN5282_c0_g1~~TRINITY_DN5282_c0_g1_i2.p1  ORF type:complete len:300 (+),score=52.18 TRINITY_DN5282_c0_g1_i2:31-930(+)